MTEISIVIDWLSRPVNHEKVPVLSYSKPVYDFITATCSKITAGGVDFYKVNNSWQQIKFKNESNTK